MGFQLSHGILLLGRRIEQEVWALAKAVNDHVFIISAGPMANAIIPLMSRANPVRYQYIGMHVDVKVCFRSRMH
jgi:hypothetical protein